MKEKCKIVDAYLRRGLLAQNIYIKCKNEIDNLANFTYGKLFLYLISRSQQQATLMGFLFLCSL